MRIPVHVLTGFLGSGKTTLLDHLLRTAEAPRERIAVLVNELGDVSLDHALVENIDDDVAVLSSGCVCCTLRDTLSESFARVRSLSPDRIVLETTGIADPAPVVHALATDPRLTDGLRLGSVIAAVDAFRGEPLLEAEPEARAQLALADRIVITKLDLAHEARARSLVEHLKARYPGAVVVEADRGAVPRAELLSEVPLGGLTDRGKLSSWLHDHGGPGVDTRVIELEAPVNVAALSLWLKLVTQLDGPRLLRIKGAVQSAAGEWCVLQSAQHAVSPPRALAAAPRGFSGSRLVVIARGMPAPALDRLIASAHEAARGQEV